MLLNYFKFLKNIEPKIMIGLIGIIMLVHSFFEIAEEVDEGDTHKIDTSIIMLMRDGNDPANSWGPLWLQETMRDISGLGGIVILTLMTIGAVLYLFMKGKKGQALYLLLTVSIGTLFANLLKFSYARPRPDLVPHGSYVFTDSFPSGHSMMSAVVYLSIGMLLARAHETTAMKMYFIGTAVFLALIIGISRIYLGVHWPSDVLAGWVAGAICAMIFWLIEWFWQERRLKKQP